MSTFPITPKVPPPDISQRSFRIVEGENISQKNNLTQAEEKELRISLNPYTNHPEHTKKLHQLIITKAAKTSKTSIDKTEDYVASILPEAQPIIRALVEDVTNYLKAKYPNTDIKAIIVAGKKPSAKCNGPIVAINISQWSQHQLGQAVDIFLVVGKQLIPRSNKYSSVYASIAEVIKAYPEKYSALKWGQSGSSMAHIEYMPAKN